MNIGGLGAHKDETQEEWFRRQEEEWWVVVWPSIKRGVGHMRVESSEGKRILRMRAGDIECYSRVYVDIDGVAYELTLPALPGPDG